MGLVLTEEEKMISEMAEGFFADKAPAKQLRELRDNRDETGFDRGLWAEMAEMGFAGVLIAEDHGGSNMGFMEAGLIAEQMGRTLQRTSISVNIKERLDFSCALFTSSETPTIIANEDRFC